MFRLLKFSNFIHYLLYVLYQLHMKHGNELKNDGNGDKTEIYTCCTPPLLKNPDLEPSEFWLFLKFKEVLKI